MRKENHSEEKEEFGKRIREARKKLGLSQEALADALGLLNRSTVAKWEKGTNLPRISKMQSICDLLGIDKGFLFGDYTSPNYTVESICETTGLSSTAVEKLIEWHSGKMKNKDKRISSSPSVWVDILSSILTNPYVDLFMDRISTVVLFNDAAKKASLRMHLTDEYSAKKKLIDFLQFYECRIGDASGLFHKILRDISL